MKKWFLAVIVAVLLIGFIGYQFLYKKHRDISTEEASFTLTVPGLMQQFTTGDSLANSTYADKTILISGTITSVDAQANSITIDEKLSAVLKDSIARNFKIQQVVKIKGRFVGYDDLLEELKMDQVTPLN